MEISPTTLPGTVPSGSGTDRPRWQTPDCDTSACVKVLLNPDQDMVLVESTVFGQPGVFDLEEWRAFIDAAKQGKYDV